MKNKSIAILALTVGVLIASVPLWAHHGSAEFDVGKQITMKGAVTEWIWANPHCWLKYDVTDEQGNVVHWVVETSNPPDMINSGWTKQSLKPGDQITVTVEPVKNGKPVGHLLEVLLPDGHKLSAWGGTKGAAARAASPDRSR